MPTEDHTPSAAPRFLHNQRQNLAGAWARQADSYRRGLSQYGENAVEPSLPSSGGY